VIEFAPNPSGPAHLGTLRTYAKAWLLAKKRNEQLFVRFDAHNIHSAAHRRRTWAVRFIDELRELDMMPDAHEYLGQVFRAATLPEWALIKKIPWGHDTNGVPNNDGPLTDVAYYPKSVPTMILPDDEPTHYKCGKPEPCVAYGVTTSPCWHYFAVRNGAGWMLDESLVALQRMHFRGVTCIVRSSLSMFLHFYLELPAGVFFQYTVPETLKVDVVSDEHGALSKHRLGDANPGTVKHALNEFGVSMLRDRVLASANEEDIGVTRGWREIIGA